jgi:hypothetical protein
VVLVHQAVNLNLNLNKNMIVDQYQYLQHHISVLVDMPLHKDMIGYGTQMIVNGYVNTMTVP